MTRVFGIEDLLFIVLAARWTLLLALLGATGGALLGIGVALARTSPSRVLRAIAFGYIRSFQSTPLLMQLFLVYFGIGILGVSINPLAAAALGLVLNAAAFLGEIWRGCIEAVPHGQAEAGQALGLKRWQRLLLVTLPQAARIAVAPTVGFLVQLVKNTSLAAIIGFAELTRSGQIVNNATFRPFTVFLVVALVYFCICWPMSWVSQRLEARLNTGRRTAGPVLAN